jgi:hypothetical protein
VRFAPPQGASPALSASLNRGPAGVPEHKPATFGWWMLAQMTVDRLKPQA